MDASVALKWVLNEAGSAWARGLPVSGPAVVAPARLWTGCANALWRIARTRATGTTDAAQAFRLICAVPVHVVAADAPMQAEALRLAQALDHPACDCLYLALAHGATLATADARLTGAIRRASALTPPAG